MHSSSTIQTTTTTNKQCIHLLQYKQQQPINNALIEHGPWVLKSMCNDYSHSDPS